MRQIFSSTRLENVEGVARLLNEAGIETYISNPRTYKGNRRGGFSYRDGRAEQSGVWIVNAGDLTRAREILRDAGLIQSTRDDSYLSQQLRGDDAPRRRPAQQLAFRVRLVLLAAIAVLALLSIGRMLGKA